MIQKDYRAPRYGTEAGFIRLELWETIKTIIEFLGLFVATVYACDLYSYVGEWMIRLIIAAIIATLFAYFFVPGGDREGALADIVLIDLNQTQSIDSKEFASKGKNTPFAGQICTGWPAMTIVEGQIVWDSESAAE